MERPPTSRSRDSSPTPSKNNSSSPSSLPALTSKTFHQQHSNKRRQRSSRSSSKPPRRRLSPVTEYFQYDSHLPPPWSPSQEMLRKKHNHKPRLPSIDPRALYQQHLERRLRVFRWVQQTGATKGIGCDPSPTSPPIQRDLMVSIIGTILGSNHSYFPTIQIGIAPTPLDPAITNRSVTSAISSATFVGTAPDTPVPSAGRSDLDTNQTHALDESTLVKIIACLLVWLSCLI